MTRQQKQYWKKLRDYEARTLKAIRRCFVEPEYHEDCTACYIASEHKPLWTKFAIIGTCFLLLLAVFFQVRCAHAEDIAGHDVHKWADAIYKTENSRNHPYGVMAHYRHTTARQACINTVRHKYRIRNLTYYLAKG